MQFSLPRARLLQFGLKAMAFSARLPLPLQLQASRRNCNGYVLKYLNHSVTVGRGTLLRFMSHGDHFRYGGIFGIMPLQFWLVAWLLQLGFKSRGCLSMDAFAVANASSSRKLQLAFSQTSERFRGCRTWHAATIHLSWRHF